MYVDSFSFDIGTPVCYILQFGRLFKCSRLLRPFPWQTQFTHRLFVTVLPLKDSFPLGSKVKYKVKKRCVPGPGSSFGQLTWFRPANLTESLVKRNLLSSRGLFGCGNIKQTIIR